MLVSQYSQHVKEEEVKNRLAIIILALTMLFPGIPAYADGDSAQVAADVKDPVGKFTGKYWIKTPQEAKEAYLFGIESAVQIENSIKDKLSDSKSRKDRAYILSPFVKGWMKAFVSTGRTQIIKEVDDWYNSHPDQLNRPVLDVIWYELVQPRLTGEK